MNKIHRVRGYLRGDVVMDFCFESLWTAFTNMFFNFNPNMDK